MKTKFACFGFSIFFREIIIHLYFLDVGSVSLEISNFWRKWEKEIYTLINPSVVRKTRLLYTHIHKKTQTEHVNAK